MSAENTMQEYMKILALLTDSLGSEKLAERWLETSNPMLGNIKPIDLILNGQHRKLADFIKVTIKGSIS